MLPYKLPEHEATFHPASFNSPERWQTPTWCRSPPIHPQGTIVNQDHHLFHNNHFNNNGTHRDIFQKEDPSNDQVPLENPNFVAIPDSSGPPKWESPEEVPNTQPTSTPVPTSNSESGETFWSSTLSRVAAVAAAAMACAAVPSKNHRNDQPEYEEIPQLVNEESIRTNAKDSWNRGQRKLQGRR